jgi:hypothetical protein
MNTHYDDINRYPSTYARVLAQAKNGENSFRNKISMQTMKKLKIICKRALLFLSWLLGGAGGDFCFLGSQYVPQDVPK